jgi:hypothetical protein
MWAASSPAPDYLLLVGDASNDIAGHALGNGATQYARSDSNYVPVMTLAGTGWAGQTRLVSCDHWYVDNLAGDWFDEMSLLPDLFLGRIPCGSPAELSRYVEKVLDYEQADPTADWRNRLVSHADDTFSWGAAALGGLAYKYAEIDTLFMSQARASLTSLTGDSLFDYMTIDTLFMSAIMDSLPELGRCELDPDQPTRCLRDERGRVVLKEGPIDVGPSRDFGLGQMNEMLHESLGAGALLWAFNGHANRLQLTHEYVFLHHAPDDVAALRNHGRPFVFAGFGCHLAEYAVFWEGDRLRGGDALAERMLFCCPGDLKGAIAAYGATDYQKATFRMEEAVFKSMFEQPPVDEEGHTRWHLGEIMVSAATQLPSTDVAQIIYMLLGDPGLRVGIAPPHLELLLNDRPWDPGASSEFISERAGDSLTVLIRARDESHLLLPQIKDYTGGIYGWVPDSLLDVVAPQSDDRRMSVLYRTQVQRRPYALLIRAEDRVGSHREIEIPVPMTTGFFEQSEGQLIPLGPGSFIDTSRVVVTLRSGAQLSAEDVRLLAGGLEVPLEAAELVREDGGGAYNWTFRFGRVRGLRQGPADLEFQIRQHDGVLLTVAELSVQIGEGRLYFKSCYWIPNPFAEQTTLVYDLSLPASRVRLRLFSASGRCLRTVDNLPDAKGVGSFVWNGVDEDGDALANGLYFFELTAWDEGSEHDEVIDKVMRAR